MTIRQPNTLQAFYEPGREEQMLRALVAESMLNNVEIDNKFNELVEIKALHDQMSPNEDSKPLGFFYPIDTYKIRNRHIRRTLAKIASIEPLSDTTPIDS